jgi:uncharacterized flavoprotein (TIGR03862 family)
MLAMKAIVIGTGPAALIAADKLCDAGFPPALFERRPGPGRKLLIAGSSGLNVTYEAEDLASFYPERRSEVAACLKHFDKNAWLSYLRELGLETFEGTSRRHFLKSMKASPLVRAWVKRLEAKGASFHYNEELIDFSSEKNQITAIFRSGKKINTSTMLLALGGGSYEERLPTWIELLRSKKISVKDLSSANAGYHLEASQEFFAAAEGKPIKGAKLQTARGEKTGELMITRYGLEGTPVYTVGCTGAAWLDLKPDMPLEKVLLRLEEARGSPWKRVQKSLKLSDGAELLAQFLAPATAWETLENAAKTLKNFPIRLLEARPLAEAISSRGGLSWDELNSGLELKNHPGVFAAGEMMDWDAPTGGFLIQASVATGFVAGQAMAERLKRTYILPSSRE